MSQSGNIQFNYQKLLKSGKPIVAVKFSRYNQSDATDRYYASKTITLDSNSYTMHLESLPTIQRSIKMLGGLSTIGNVSVTLLNQDESQSDFFRVNGLGFVMGEAIIALLFNDGTDPLWTERLELFNGITDNATGVGLDKVIYSIYDNNPVVMNKRIGKTFEEEYANCPEDIKNSLIPIAVGNNIYNGADTSVVADFTFRTEHCMVPLKKSRTGYHLSQVAVDGSILSIDRVWAKHKETGRMMLVDDLYWSNTNGLITLEFYLGNPILLTDYYRGSQVTFATTEYWDEEQIINDDITDSTRYTNIAEDVSYDGVIKFDTWNVDVEDSNINSINLFARADDVDDVDTDCVWTLKGLSIAGSTGTIQDLGAYSTESVAEIENDVNIHLIIQVGGGTGNDFDIYSVWKQISYHEPLNNLEEKYDLFASVKGLVYGSWLTSRTSHQDNGGGGAGSLITNPSGVIEQVCRTYLGLTDSDIDTDAFDTASVDRSSWSLDFIITDFTSADELLDKLAFEAGCWLYWNYENKLSILAWQADPEFAISDTTTPCATDVFIHHPEYTAVDFSGADNNSAITFPVDSAHQITGFMTVEGWFKFDSFNTHNTLLICEGSTAAEASSNVLYSLRCTAANTFEYKHEYGTDTSESKTFTLDANLVADTWYHIALTRDTVTAVEIVSLIIRDTDGTVIESESTSYTNTPANGTSSFLTLGNYQSNAACFNGKMKEIRLWSDARTTAELTDNMNDILVGNEAGLVGYWRLDGIGAAVDITSNQVNGVMGTECSEYTASNVPIRDYYPQHLIKEDTLVIDLMDTADLVTDLTVNYNKNTDGNFVNSITDTNNTTIFGSLEEILDLNFVRDTTTATALRDNLLTRKSEKYYIATFTTWLNAADKTEGDIINIRHPLLDAGILTHTDMVGARWQILELNHDLNSCEIQIKAILVSPLLSGGS